MPPATLELELLLPSESSEDHGLEPPDDAASVQHHCIRSIPW